MQRLQLVAKSFMRVLPAFLSLGRILVYLMYVYAMVGMELFPNSKVEAEDKFAHFESFPGVLLLLFQMLTTSNWCV